MAKNIIMQVLTSAGYEPMYPFNPTQTLNAKVESTSTATRYNLTIVGLTTPLTNAIGNPMGLISFVPNVNSGSRPKISINGDTARPILFANGTNLTLNTLVAGRPILVKYYNGNFYIPMDKNRIGLSNVDNTADIDKPISRATQTALNNKINLPILVPRSSNLNTYTTAGFYYNPNNSDASTMTNLPTQVAFSLLVERHNGVKQTFTSNTAGNGLSSWVRNYSNGKWGNWVRQAYVLYGTSTPASNIGFDGNIYIKYE